MKAAMKTEAGWEKIQFPSNHTEQSKWLRVHDGEDFVVVGDDGVRYCGNEQTLNAYQSQGKDAKMFIDLDLLLFEAHENGKPFPLSQSSCLTGEAAACSNKADNPQCQKCAG